MLNQKEIIAKANEVFSECNPKEEIPFPFENLQKYRIDFFTGKEFEELFDGKAAVKSIVSFNETSDRFRVYVNHKLPLETVYFSMATSIAHVFLHESELKKEKIFFDIEEYPFVSSDIEANLSKTLREEGRAFAYNLLLPAALVEKAWEELHDPREVAKLFSVGLYEITNRLKFLKLI